METNWLMFAVLAAVVSTLGSLLALYIKDVVIEDRKEKKLKDGAFHNHKAFLAAAVRDLADAFAQIIDGFPTNYLGEEVLSLTPASLANTTDDPHYRKYKYIRTLYRLCSFFGWLEVNRIDNTFFQSSSGRQNDLLQQKLRKIKGIFSEGRLIGIYGNDWSHWKDRQIFNEEQRALGEGMLIEYQEKTMVIGFGKFQELVAAYTTEGKPLWLVPAFTFITNMQAEKDFRRDRILYLLKAFGDILDMLSPGKYDDTQREIKRIITGADAQSLIGRLEGKNGEIY
jgi:hypothetical protein